MSFSLSWRGGATERRLRERRPGGDDLPWGTIELSNVSPQHQIDARRVWSNGVFTEYASAAAFSALTGALLEAGAPVDLVAASADIVVDEMFHVELSSRLTMELGGAISIAFDVAAISPVKTNGRPVLRAAELALTTSCIGETLSVPALARSRVLATEPLVRAVLDRLLADEGPHARIGWWVLDAVADELSDAERLHLGALADETIAAYASLWDDCGCPVTGLGGPDQVGRSALRSAVDTSIVAPLRRYGIACSYTSAA